MHLLHIDLRQNSEAIKIKEMETKSKSPQESILDSFRL